MAVDIGITYHVNISIPSYITVFDDDKTLFLKATDIDAIKEWLSNTLTELEELS